MVNYINAKGQLERNAASTDRLDVMVAAMWELMFDKIKEQKKTPDPRCRISRRICDEILSQRAALAS